MKKIIFTRDFAPYKKGDVKELSPLLTRHYISIYAAKHECDCEDGDKEPCIGCGDKAKEVVSSIVEPTVIDEIAIEDMSDEMLSQAIKQAEVDLGQETVDKLTKKIPTKKKK